MSGACSRGLEDEGAGTQRLITALPPRTKIFIRFPKTLFATEDSLEVRRQSLGERLTLAVPWGSWGMEMTAFGLFSQETCPPSFSCPSSFLAPSKERPPAAPVQTQPHTHPLSSIDLPLTDPSFLNVTHATDHARPHLGVLSSDH